MDNICMVCEEVFEGVSQTIELSDSNNRDKFHITGHISCTDEVMDKIKSMKDFKKMKLDKVLEELGFDNKGGK